MHLKQVHRPLVSGKEQAVRENAYRFGETTKARMSGSQTQSVPVSDNLKKSIEEVAREHAKNGTFHAKDEDFLALKKQFMEPVTPNRANLFQVFLQRWNKGPNAPNGKYDCRVFDGYGNQVGSYDGMGNFASIMTPMEARYSDVFNKIYNDAYFAEKAALEGGLDKTI